MPTNTITTANSMGEWKASQIAEDLPRLEQENLASDYTIMENSMENTKDNT